MKLRTLFLWASFCSLLLNSCGNSDDDVSFDLNANDFGKGEEADDCLGFGENDLILSIQEQFTTPPSKISILFRVNDADGNPVAGLTASQFTIYEQGRNDDCFNTISSSESFARISSNAQVFDNNTLLILDLSNSVLQGSLSELKAAANRFVNNVMPKEESDAFKMGIYWFDGEDKLHELQDLTASKTALTDAIDGIDQNISQDPSTDLYGAVIKSTALAEDLIAQSRRDKSIGAASIVLFTDGTDQASRYSEASAINAVEAADVNISIYTIGLGAEIDTEVLEAIGKTSSVVANNAAELETTFNQVSARVAERANSFYLFEYCTPKRDGSGINNLVIRVLQGSRQGAVQTQFDATGFSSGCE